MRLARDEGNRSNTTLESLAALEPVFKDGQFVQQGRYITAGNASQLSDGASAVVVMDGELAGRLGLQPLGAYRGVAVAGCRPRKWVSGRCLQYPNCCSAMDSRSRI